MNSVGRKARFLLPDAFDARRLATSLEPYGAASLQVRRLHTMHFDSQDLRLARWGISLRYRAGEAWTVQLPLFDGDPHSLSRLEFTFEGTGPEQPPADALDLVSGTLRGASVGRVAELRTLRIAGFVERRTGGTVGELACDDVHLVRDGHTVRRYRQVEIELAPSAKRRELRVLARRLCRKTFARPTSLTQDRFALGAANVTRETYLTPLQRRPRRSDMLRWALAPALETLVRADPHLRMNDDPEWVHIARVSTRKLRASLKIFEPALRSEWTTDAHASLKRLSDLLGAVRDADVLGGRVKSLGASLPPGDAGALARIEAPIATSRNVAYDLLRTALRETWYVALLDTLLAAVRDGPPLADADRTMRPRRFVARTMRRSWKKLKRAASRTGANASVVKLHELRILAKRCRYVADALAPLLHGDRARARRRFVKRLARLQDRLGSLHDIAAERDTLRAAADTDRFVKGELVGLDLAHGLAIRSEWNAAWLDTACRRFRFWR